MSKRLLALVEDALEADSPPALEYVVAKEQQPASWRVWLLLIALIACAALAAAVWWQQAAAQVDGARRRSPAHGGLLVPAPSDPGWVDYYRSKAEAVQMAVHLPAVRTQNELVVWEKFAQQQSSVVALSEVHYDCARHTRRAPKMAVYRNGVFGGYAYDAAAAEAVMVAPDSVEDDALALVCFGTAPAEIDDPDPPEPASSATSAS